MKNTLLILTLVVVVLAGGYMLMNRQNSSGTMEVTPADGMQAVEEGVTNKDAMERPGDAVVQEEAMSNGEKQFTVDSFEFGFDQKTLTVNAGDTVTINLTNSGNMLHDWVVDEFDARTEQIKKGDTSTVTFVADKAGTYEFYCSVGQHRANGMVGTLVVK